MSDANSIHTQKWVESLSQQGFEILLFSFFDPQKKLANLYKQNNIRIISQDLNSKINNLRTPNLSKIKYVKSLPILRKTIKDFKPEIIHAHYASSYGILGMLTGFKPFILSVWGSDISHFPYKNSVNRWLIRLVIKKATKICSTSNFMKKIIENEYNRLDVEVIPFGVDVNRFKPTKKLNKSFTVGTIKSIENHNGIDCLVNAAKIVIREYKKNINFLIVGDGSLKNELQQKTKELKLDNNIQFVDHVMHQNVYDYYKKLSVFIAVSKRESFGVSVLEAASCGIPAITSNIGGLKEVNLNNETGIVINHDDPVKLAESIVLLSKKDKLRLEMGQRARERVVKYFNWNESVSQMIKVYKSYR